MKKIFNREFAEGPLYMKGYADRKSNRRRFIPLLMLGSKKVNLPLLLDAEIPLNQSHIWLDEQVDLFMSSVEDSSDYEKFLSLSCLFHVPYHLDTSNSELCKIRYLAQSIIVIELLTLYYQ